MFGIFEKFSIGLLQEIMKREWLLAALLIISFFDMYLNLRLGFSLAELLNGQKDIGWYSIIEAGIIFSFIYAAIFPVIKWIYFFIILFVLPECGIYIRMNKNYNYRKSLYWLKRKAVKEDNSVLWSACQEEEARLNKISFVFSAAWGILIFSILGCFGASNKSILIDIIFVLCKNVEDNSFISFVIFLLLSIGLLGHLSILYCSLYPQEKILPYWEDDKNSSS